MPKIESDVFSNAASHDAEPVKLKPTVTGTGPIRKFTSYPNPTESPKYAFDALYSRLPS